ncbi:MAG: tripartite tricarboxylate transporter TctB family protein, partial [Burkholderiales bacterium]
MNRATRIIIGACVLLAAAGVAGGLSSIDNAGGYSGLSPRFLPTLVAVGLALCGGALVLGA